MSAVRWRTRPSEAVPLLVDTAMGRTPADVVVRNARLVNVNTGEIEKGVDVAVRRDRIALVGDARPTIGPRTRVIDASGMYLAPGLIDSHMHIESSMLTPAQFARAVLPRGTTTVFVDPHEMGNVLGMEGVRYMLKESLGLPLKVYFTLPSCVPALPRFETAGAKIGPRDIARALKWPHVVALGEMMNYPGVLAADPNVLGEIEATLASGMLVEGHSPGLKGQSLSAYTAAGITSCHESTGKEEALEKLRRGMYLQIREGSAWLDLKENIRAVTEEKVDSRHVCLVTDDRDSGSLIRQGHMDHVVRRAIEEGVDPVVAIEMATINGAEHFEMGRYLGSIAPMRSADMLLLPSLEEFKPSLVMADGRVVAQDGRLSISIPQPAIPKEMTDSIHLKRLPVPGDFSVKAGKAMGTVQVRAIGVTGGSVYTREVIEEVPVRDGEAKISLSKDLLKVAVVERHHATGRTAVAFTTGFGFEGGAVGSTVAHDSHNLLLVGTDEKEMAFAAERVTEQGGGMLAVRNGKVLGSIRMRVAGLVSDSPVEEVSAQAEGLLEAWRRMGCRMVEPFMTMSLITLTVLPKLRISDRGLLDTDRFRFVEPLLG
ncbi:MAG TPA: adenine deaminase [Conexivisphaerales archaeon]|nr:adenine deaminase [Conexivisphaerales archaeon]